VLVPKLSLGRHLFSEYISGRDIGSSGFQPNSGIVHSELFKSGAARYGQGPL